MKSNNRILLYGLTLPPVYLSLLPSFRHRSTINLISIDNIYGEGISPYLHGDQDKYDTRAPETVVFLVLAHIRKFAIYFFGLERA